MSIQNSIPKIWSARMMEHLNNSLVYCKLLNRNYEGEIKNFGDTVKIFSLNNLTVKQYTRNTDIDDPEQLATNEQVLTIDQSDSFNFAIDDIDKFQSRLELVDKAAANASYQLANKADVYTAGLLKVGTAVENLGDDSTPIVVTDKNAYELLVRMKTILDRKNVPQEGRWVVMPPEYEGFMLLDPRFAYNTGKSEQRLENGKVGRACGFNIHISNNVPNESGQKYKIIASWNDCGTYAEQILKTETYKMEKRFGNGVKGLHVYGAKILRPETIAVATVNFTAGE